MDADTKIDLAKHEADLASLGLKVEILIGVAIGLTENASVTRRLLTKIAQQPNLLLSPSDRSELEFHLARSGDLVKKALSDIRQALAVGEPTHG